MKIVCWSCQTVAESIETISRTQECVKCLVDLHCCRMCKFYEESTSNGCKETQAEYVHRKEKANFCDYFKPGIQGIVEESKADDAKAKLNALFKF